MRLENFEDLNAWKEARKLRKMVSMVSRKSSVSKDNVFCSQIRAAALSVMSNIAEGFESVTNKEMVQFLGFARRSCGEVRSQLYAALDDEYINREEFNTIYKQTVLTGKLITGFMSYLRKLVKNIQTIKP